MSAFDEIADAVYAATDEIFGDSATYHYAGGGSASVTVICDLSTLDVGNAFEVSAPVKMIAIEKSSITTPSRGDHVDITSGKMQGYYLVNAIEEETLHHYALSIS